MLDQDVDENGGLEINLTERNLRGDLIIKFLIEQVTVGPRLNFAFSKPCPLFSCKEVNTSLKCQSNSFFQTSGSHNHPQGST